MGKKVIKLDFEDVVIANEDGSTTRALYEWFNFKPEIGDLVDVFPDGDELIIHKATTIAENIQDKININIVNENNNTQTVGGYVQHGRVVNKWIYFILAFFLGWFGVHKFYSGFTGKGIMYLVFSWTGIPAIIAFFTAIATLLKPADQNGNIVVTS
ncbi:TM2 domain-containing protein [Candidatus Enterococcus ikei]|uniref:TM2 domain-containing protein n=1 Tax=Candidatus Enterococcus ikei TaxID=2815326 RepID=A0ABS3GYW4_9ENTE|nr:TM2 domain-containing protein [Enterococcus sp. DIV0869a]MBO0440410.1 TM2 domain-containing protein [Enterococcus sp. DIV0869a]